MSDATPEVTETKEEPKPEEMLTKALAGFEGAPKEDEIVAWKNKHGDIFCSGFSEQELFVWRPVTRHEFSGFQVEIAQAQQQGLVVDVEEKIVKNCILWSSVKGNQSLSQKAGSLSTLHEQIMQQSNFMDPRVAAALVIKL